MMVENEIDVLLKELNYHVIAQCLINYRSNVQKFYSMQKVEYDKLMRIKELVENDNKTWKQIEEEDRQQRLFGEKKE